MNLTLKRISYDRYDELMGMINIDTFFDKSKNEVLKRVEEFSDPVRYNGQPVTIPIDIDKYENAIKESNSKGEASAKIAKILYKDFVIEDKHLPDSIMYEKEVWTYLNLTIFFDLTKKKFISEDTDEDKLIGKIKRYYFNDGGLSKLDRTGLRYLWVLADILTTNKSTDLIDIAIEFADPFKAVQECVLGNNPMVLKAYALAIKKLNCDARLKNHYFRKLVPKHIRNHACSNFYDGYSDPNQLADVIAKQIELIFENYSAFGYLDENSGISI